jgi:hypothetical protein
VVRVKGSMCFWRQTIKHPLTSHEPENCPQTGSRNLEGIPPQYLDDKRTTVHVNFKFRLCDPPQNVNTANKKRASNLFARPLRSSGGSRWCRYLPELLALPVVCALALGMLT